MCKHFSSPFAQCPIAKASHTAMPRIRVRPDYPEAWIQEGELQIFLETVHHNLNMSNFMPIKFENLGEMGNFLVEKIKIIYPVTLRNEKHE